MFPTLKSPFVIFPRITIFNFLQNLLFHFKDKLIPNAVLFFTNEYVDPEVESDEEEDVDESDSDENSDENGLTEEEDVEQRENPECKQQ